MSSGSNFQKIQPSETLSRDMGLLPVTMIGVGAMIGAGIFVLTGMAAGAAGPALTLSFLLNGFVTIFTAMVYAELGSSFHDAGGGYLWVKEGLPQPNGFISGWMSWFAHMVACSLYSLGFGAYFSHVLKEMHLNLFGLSSDVLAKILAVVIVCAFSYINLRGASETGSAAILVAAFKIAVLAMFITFGLIRIFKNSDSLNHFRDFMPNGWGGVFIAMGLTFIAFEGYEIIAQCSEEVKNPKRNIPRAVFLSLLIVVPIYILIAFVAIGAVEGGGIPTWKFLGLHKETALVEAARH
ncbi:MAG: APC family permease, partial [Candidatus Aminicenantes bacterium]|nr:APC family permease [Candidatus Aminicenantes bacterium]